MTTWASCFEAFFGNSVKYSQKIISTISLIKLYVLPNALRSGPFRAKVAASYNYFSSVNYDFFIQEIWGGVASDYLTLKAGYQVFTWSYLDVFRPSDIINPVNYYTDVSKPNKIGEPAVNLSIAIGEGELSFLYFPVLQSAVFPAKNHRMYPFGSFDMGEAKWVESDYNYYDNDFAHQGAVHYKHFFSSVGLYAFWARFMDRQHPRYSIDFFKNRISPIYFMADHYGLGMNAVIGDFIFKMDGVYMDFLSHTATAIDGISAGNFSQTDHATISGGMEYSLNTRSASSTMLILEYQRVFCDCNDINKLNMFASDIFFGINHQFNNFYNMEFQTGLIVDLEGNNELLWNFSYTQRLVDLVNLTVSGALFYAPSNALIPSGLEVYHRNNYIKISLDIYFTLDNKKEVL